MTARSIGSIVISLGKLSSRWLNPNYSFRRKAVSCLVRRSGFSENMAEAMLDAIFSQLTEPKLWKLLKSELRSPGVLDRFQWDPQVKAWLRARGPETILHVFSSNIPQVSILSFVLGMLLKSHNVGKLSSRDEGFLRVYLQSLKTADAALWRANALSNPKNRTTLSAAAKKADMVVAYGSDESLRQIQKEVPATTPFFAYGHRISAAIYSKEVLTKKNVQALAYSAAHDVWMADQRGCLSPVTVYAQTGGSVSPLQFAECLAMRLRQLQKKEKVLPRREISMALAASRLRSQFFMKKIRGERAEFWESHPRGHWAVAYDENPKPLLPASSQLLSVQGFKKIEQLYPLLRPVQKYLQCIALECAAGQRKKISEKLSELGINRICRSGCMQSPPITWHHDGKPNLASWIRWTDLEK